MARPERILAQELLGLEVLDLGAGTVLGTVVDFAVSRDGRVALIGILPVEWYRGGQGVAPAGIAAINPERVCLVEGATLAPFAPDGQELFSANFGDAIQGKTILQQDGELLGVLADFAFSLDDGRIQDIVVLDAEDKKVRVPVSAFRTLGRDYVVVERGAPALAGEPQSAPAQTVPAAAESAPATAESTHSESATATDQRAGPVTRRAVGAKAGGAKPGAAAASEDAAEAAAPAASGPEKAVAAAGQAGEAAQPGEQAKVFLEARPEPELSKFDQKKRDFLRGRMAHRDITGPTGEVIVAKGAPLDGGALAKIIEAGLLGEVFVEMTLSK